MKPGPLRRLTGALGLVALAPTAAMLALGALTLADAALRAGVTLVGVTAIGRGAGWWLSSTAARFERRTPAADPDPADRRRARPADRVT
ncbi:MAG TPA: hypothetical protein VM324_10660 [Egibacteraceae bacterium]|nr:hypothetical protein [Egibacteraceae bacterium]